MREDGRMGYKGIDTIRYGYDAGYGYGNGYGNSGRGGGLDPK